MDITEFVAALPKTELHLHLVGSAAPEAVLELAQHPLPTLLAAGVPVTLATDDPVMFHTSLNDEYLHCHHAFGLTAAGLAGLARAGARAAFCPAPTRRAILAEIDRRPYAVAADPRGVWVAVLGQPMMDAHAVPGGGKLSLLLRLCGIG